MCFYYLDSGGSFFGQLPREENGLGDRGEYTTQHAIGDEHKTNKNTSETQHVIKHGASQTMMFLKKHKSKRQERYQRFTLRVLGCRSEDK